jgi:hypothetical protein
MGVGGGTGKNPRSLPESEGLRLTPTLSASGKEGAPFYY